MQKGSYLSTILRSSKTVLSSKDIAELWDEPMTPAARVRLNYYHKNGYLYRIRKGLYAKNRDYYRLELATRIFSPSYVSFETVLINEGLIFQYYDKIYVASYLTREITADKQTYSYRKVKTGVLINNNGVERVDQTFIATKERAFLDILYVNTDYWFDNIRSINWNRVFEILPLYSNKRMAKKVQTWYQYANSQS